MSVNTKIFQIYYEPSQISQLDPDLIPCDNTVNDRPELREWHVWQREMEQRQEDDCDYYGYLSWRYKDKLNLTGNKIKEWIAANPGYDVYLINPCILNEAVFVNSWEQGDIWHPNISTVGNEFLRKLGYEDYDVKSVVIDRNSNTYANYFVASKKFWQDFMTFTGKLFSEAEKDSSFNEMVFGAGKSNYSRDPSLPNFTFLIERLLPTYIELEGIKSICYEFTSETVLDKYKDIFSDIQVLSDLKIEVNRHGTDELFAIWNYYRQKFLQEHPGILGLE